MKIAVTYEDGQVFQHFGHTEKFKIYEVEDGEVIGHALVGSEGNGHGALTELLSGLNVDTLICGGIGAGARQLLTQAGIRLYGGVSGNADDAVSDLLAGTLQYNANAACDHHDHHEHHGEGHCAGDRGGCAGNSGARCH